MSLDKRQVALGPVPGSDWRLLDQPPDGLLAPGGVVLCWEGSETPHPAAELAARSAWELLDRWCDAQRGSRPAGATPTP